MFRKYRVQMQAIVTQVNELSLNVFWCRGNRHNSQCLDFFIETPTYLFIIFVIIFSLVS